MTSLVAVAVPAAAGSSDTSATPPDLGSVAGQLQPSATPSATDSPAVASGTGSTTNGTTTPAAADTTTAPASSDPATCIQSAGSNFLGLLNCLTPTGSSNPITSIVTQLQAAAAGGGAPGVPTSAFQDLATCVQGALTGTTPSASDVIGCIKTFSGSITGSQQQLNCLTPILQGALGGVQGLVSVPPNPAPLQAELTGLQGQLTTLATCLQGSPSPTPTAGTSTSSGEATTPATTTASDPTEAVPVAATPNFTG